MVQDVMGERLFQAHVHTSLKAFDGINAVNTMTDNRNNEICFDHIYNIAIENQNMKHAIFIERCVFIALFEPQTGTPQGGPKATDIYNRGLQVALNQILSNTIEVSPMLNGSHLFLFEAEDLILMIGTHKKIQCAVTTFVDDIINRVATNDIKQLTGKTEQMDEIIQKELNERHVYLNKTKEQSIWSFHGKGAMKTKAQLYTDRHGAWY